MNVETLGNLVHHALEKVGTGKSGRPEMGTSLETGHPPRGVLISGTPTWYMRQQMFPSYHIIISTGSWYSGQQKVVLINVLISGGSNTYLGQHWRGSYHRQQPTVIIFMLCHAISETTTTRLPKLHKSNSHSLSLTLPGGIDVYEGILLYVNFWKGLCP